QHPRLERQVVPEAAEPVLVRMRVRVDHARHDGIAGAVEAVEPGVADRHDASLVHDDVGAGEATRADVDETLSEDLQSAVRSIAVAAATAGPPPAAPATSITASESICRESSVCGKASSSRTFAVRVTATSPAYSTPAISQHSSGIGPQSCCVL